MDKVDRKYVAITIFVFFMGVDPILNLISWISNTFFYIYVSSRVDRYEMIEN